ncbi:hypothetical protein BV25DRAFT_1869547 [Artomyces pyxidatus]|uniref:Uncharacterized protein n=1 Tax=Artomyces pyxidatus TaxID=48021 RepID=A0ACB8T5Y8_9AGAM|nr:hypothetical protein BV25DRAFT_1869547 [Artomyces pyxidatus]
MSTLSLPSYTPDHNHSPAYSAEPQQYERRLLVPPRQRPSSEFVKQSRSGELSLRLAAQVDGVTTPMYALRELVEGTVEIAKPDGLAYVAVKVEGFLKLKEIAEGGTTTVVLCNETITLWRKGVDPGPCPSSLPFSAPLPTTFADEKTTYSLPPTYEAHLTGLPGFTVNVDYSVTAIASKTKNSVLGIGATTVSTPFIYYPRTRPSSPLPPPLEQLTAQPGLRETHERAISALYLPKSQVFCMNRPIPFHIAFVGSAMSLATLLPYMPSRSGQALGKPCTRIQILRQSTVDVKNDYIPNGTKTEMWRTSKIGEGTIHRTGDGPEWLTFAGELKVNPEVTIGGFKAGGLWVKDCVVLTIMPPDALKGPIGDMRLVVPIRLVTHPWTAEAYVEHVSPAPSENETYEPSDLAYLAE